MLVSHHPPCDYDHTFRIGTLRICTRCAGITLGGIASISVLVVFGPLHGIIPLWTPFLLPIPAVVDFITHELAWRKSNNVLRWVSGVFLGFAAGWGGYALLHGKASQGILLITWLASLEVIVAIILRTTGRLERFIERYEKAVRGGGELKDYREISIC